MQTMPSANRTKFTKQQREAALTLYEKGYGEYRLFPYCSRNKPYWHLVEIGIAVMDFGPRGSWLRTYYFLPLWEDPVC